VASVEGNVVGLMPAPRARGRPADRVGRRAEALRGAARRPCLRPPPSSSA
jgi:hypothetical protein